MATVATVANTEPDSGPASEPILEPLNESLNTSLNEAQDGVDMSGRHAEIINVDERVARLRQELLESAEIVPDNIADLVRQIQQTSPEASITARNDAGETSLHVLEKLVHGMPKEDIYGPDSNPESMSALHVATSRRLPETVSALLEAGADAFVKDDEGCTPLHYACWQGELEIAKCLVDYAKKRNRDLDIYDDQDCTPLDDACRQGHLDIVKLLVKADAQVDSRDGLDWTPLRTATNYGHTEIVEFLLENNADPLSEDNKQRTPIHCACWRGMFDALKVLLKSATERKKNLDLNLRDHKRHTPLYHACANGYIDCARLLLDQETQLSNGISASEWAKVDVDIPGESNWTPVGAATRFGYEEVVKLLLRHHADITICSDEGSSPLHEASLGGELSLVTSLVEHTIENKNSLDVQDDSGCTPLDHACSNGYASIVNLLLCKGADVEVRDREDWTPLMSASHYGHDEVVKLLLGKEADTEASDKDGWTPLKSASRYGHEEVVKILLHSKAKVNTATRDGWTPLMSASRYGHEEVVKLLLGSNANVQARDTEGFTALALSCWRGHGEIVRRILEKWQCEVKPDNEKQNPLMKASRQGYADIVETIILSGRIALDDTDNKGETALYMACYSDYTEDEEEEGKELGNSAPGRYEDVIKLLLIHKAAIELKPNTHATDTTALHPAVRANKTDRVKVLVGSDQVTTAIYSAVNKEGRTALEIAVENRQAENVGLLLQKGPLKLRKVDDNTLYWAAGDERSHQLIRQELLRRVPRDKDLAEITGKGKHHWTALDWATFHGDYILVSKLLDTISATDLNYTKRQHAEQIATAMLNDPKLSVTSNRKQKAVSGSGPTLEVDENTREEDRRFVRDILSDSYLKESPVTKNLEYPKPRQGTSIDFKPPVVIFDFYATNTGREVLRGFESVKQVIYGDGPDKLMESRRKRNMRLRREIADLGKSNEKERSMPEARSEASSNDRKLDLRLIHLPANNMVWMHHLLMRLLKSQAETEKTNKTMSPEHSNKYRSECEDEFRHLSSFLETSWVEFPDTSSPSRMMKPQCVKTRIPAPTAPITRPELPKPTTQEKEFGQSHCTDDAQELSSDAQKLSQEAPSKSANTPAASPEDGGANVDEKNIERIALYMPYLNFATQIGQQPPQEDLWLKYQTQCRNAYEELLRRYKGEVLHGSRTLDEFYYQFTSEKTRYNPKDIEKRNRDQVVTRWFHTEDRENIASWSLLRVDQLWLWVVDDKNIITSSTHRLDGRQDVISTRIYNYLAREKYRPNSVNDLAKLIIDICVRTYDQVKESPGSIVPSSHGNQNQQDPEATDVQRDWTIREIFANSINSSMKAAKEVELFETFTDHEGTNGSHSLTADSQNPITRPARLLSEVKDLRDELNVIKAVVSHQEAVQKGLCNEPSGGANTTSKILSEIEEMDKYAERIYNAVSATLGLEQNRISIAYSDESVRQGRVVMAFTVTTIIFLPMSFLASLFALDISSFQHRENGDLAYTSKWIFPRIFAISVAVSLVLILYAYFHGSIRDLAVKQVLRFTESFPVKFHTGDDKDPSKRGPPGVSAGPLPQDEMIRELVEKRGHTVWRRQKIRSEEDGPQGG